MRKLKVSKLWISAFLPFMLAALLTGCGDPDENPAGAPADPLTSPTVTFVTPPDASTLVCPNTPVVTATFSKPIEELSRRLTGDAEHSSQKRYYDFKSAVCGELLYIHRNPVK